MVSLKDRFVSNLTAIIINAIVVCRQKRRRTQDNLVRSLDKFLKYQNASREEFLALKERRLQREEEMEANRRREEREHELRLFQLIEGSLGAYFFPTTVQAFQVVKENVCSKTVLQMTISTKMFTNIVW